MAESAEHRFLSQAPVDFLHRAAGTRLFTTLESERKMFDFSATLVRDWSRPVVGQALWRNAPGTDKDLRTLLGEPDAEICIYVASDSTRNRSLVSEIVNSYRRGFQAQLHKLRTIWVPYDLDIEVEAERDLVRRVIEDQLRDDVLLNVVLGNLSSDSLRVFATSTGMVGLDLAVLDVIASEGFTNMRVLAERLRCGSSTLRERLTRLIGCGFLYQPDPAHTFFHTTVRGRVFLDLCRELTRPEPPDPELQRLCELLRIHDGASKRTLLGDELLRRVKAASKDFGASPGTRPHHEFWNSPAWPRSVPRPEGFHQAALPGEF